MKSNSEGEFPELGLVGDLMVVRDKHMLPYDGEVVGICTALAIADGQQSSDDEKEYYVVK